MAVFCSPWLRATRTFFSSSVMITPSRVKRVAWAFLDSGFLLAAVLSKEGRVFRTLQNSSILLRLCSTEFIKQVFPKFLKPTRFTVATGASFPFLTTLLSIFCFFALFGRFSISLAVEFFLFLLGLNDLPGASVSLARFFFSKAVRRFSRSLSGVSLVMKSSHS